MNKLNPQLLLILLVASLGLNFYQYATNVDRKSNNYPLLAKRLFVANPNDLIINFVPLRTQLRDYITKQPEKVAVYFEYLPTGNSISVGASDEFFRASLVKVPSVMRAYKLSEEGKLNLNKKITLKTEHLDSGFGNLYQSPVGTELTIREVIRLVLTDSDNTAFNLLHDEVNVKQLGDTPDGDQSIDDVYDYLDIPRTLNGVTPLISPKNFSSILRSLYFSAYLSYHNSNEILSIMTSAHEKDLLRKELPNNVKVANKIGVYQGSNPSQQVGSDCGIIYFPQRPYLLCAMVSTGSQDSAASHISTLSKITYDFISTNTK